MQDVGGDPKRHLALRRTETNCRGSRDSKALEKPRCKKA